MPRSGIRTDPFSRLWRLFCNVKFALLLILLLGILTFLGTAISQVPPPMRADPLLVERWLSAMNGRYGVVTPVLNSTGMFDVFNSYPYRILLGLLTIAVCVCTMNRIPAVWRNVTSIPWQRRASYYEHADHHAHAAGVGSSPEAAIEAIRAAWAKLGYRVLVEEGTGATRHVYADRYRLARLSTFVNHLGLIAILAGGAMTGLLGERNDGYVIPVGATKPVGLGTPYSVYLDSFTDEYYLSGGAKDYRSEVVVYEGNKEIERATVRVNEPLIVGPVKIHQAYFGSAVVMEVKKAGQTIFQESIPLAYTALPYGFRPVGFFRLPSEGLQIDLVASENSSDEAVKAGQVGIFGFPLGSDATADPIFGGVLTQRQTQRWRDLEFTFVRESQYSGFQAVRDPGAPIFFTAAGLMLLGTLVVFYFPHRKLWALVQPDGDGSEVWLAGVCPRNPGFADEFKEAVESAERALGAAPIATAQGVQS
jgi:cytochrome c biogenesis protein